MGLDGIVKIGELPRSNSVVQNVLTAIIASLESSVPFTPDQNQFSSVNRLGFLAMELMQKYVKENVGIDDTTRWPVESKAFDFLSSTTSARSMAELSGVCNEVPLSVNRLLTNLSIRSLQCPLLPAA